MHALPSNKISLIFKNMMIALPWKQNHLFQTRNLIFLRAGLCMQYCQGIIRLIFYVFCLNCVEMNVGGYIIGLEARKNLLNSEIKTPQNL